MTDEVLELLRAARGWLEDPSHWCEGQFLRFVGHSHLPVASCLTGAAYAVLYHRGELLHQHRGALANQHRGALAIVNTTLHRVAREEMGYGSAVLLNDLGGHQKALEALDRAIRRKESEAALFSRLEREMQYA